MSGFENVSIYTKLLTAGTSACIADAVTFPLDTAKVRLQIQGEARSVVQNGTVALLRSQTGTQYGLFGTLANMVRQEGARSLYNGLSAGLQRQMCFASVRIGLYDTFKTFYQHLIDGNSRSGSLNIGARVAAGLTTGGLAVFLAQPTDVVKVRFQASAKGQTTARYSSTLQAYKSIATKEGVRGLWKGTFPNVSRNAIVNVSEIVCYDIIKDTLLYYHLMKEGVPLHFTSAVIAGFCTTVVASPVDVVKTRYMNSAKGEYKGAADCGVRMFMQEGTKAFYKGFTPSFCRLVAWNIMMWITYEQMKILVGKSMQKRE
ncbi:PREDICTED: mitochondrial uncoupling protein 2-like [Nicrophorus vespilloides]|uniref:Mitochondrial uncoupling protein 2-like n=1 Tax=Nicrophorus vespilloides TaxID=110193 RepID=A0ABM1MY82_NICVS|nr:PREDICTED: mitochondrial uncoupling protein 2-like [Nicrophorus vespilloides]XP_017779532.1 PREDICTED: mitochondrial uncoupling protein 2-like [Nicrophorus vespilloides]XP_017779533.1 PREDICTED: mitochondrial uncoupling protein 2-like [Nicrophorus vespilloides]